MTKTYAQVMKQIDALSREAEKLKRKEVASTPAIIHSLCMVASSIIYFFIMPQAGRSA